MQDPLDTLSQLRIDSASRICRAPFLLIATLLSLLLCLLPGAAFAKDKSVPLDSTEDIHALSNSEAKSAYPVDFVGVVTYSDPEWGLLFVRDATGSIYVNVHGSAITYPLGTKVRVVGVTGPGDVDPIVERAHIRVLGAGQPPAAEFRSIDTLDTGAVDSGWVMTEGLAHPCDTHWNRICFRLFDGKKLVWVILPQRDGPEALPYLGAWVRVHGVSGVHLDAANRRTAAQIFVNSLRDIDILRPSPANDYAAPVREIREVLAAHSEKQPAPRTHIRGVVTWEGTDQFAVEDKTGTVFVALIRPAAVHRGNLVDVLGFPGTGPYGITLIDAYAQALTAKADPALGKAQAANADQIPSRGWNGMKVVVHGRLTRQESTAAQYTYELQDGDQHFTAILQRRDNARETVVLSNNAMLQLTGVVVLPKQSAGFAKTFLLLVDSPTDIVVMGENGWMTLRRALLILLIMAFCIAIPMLWIRTLRKTVRKQTGIIRDQLENELNMAGKYRRLFERNLAAVFTWRTDGTILDCNPSFARLLGYQNAEQLIGRSYWDFLADPEQRQRLAALTPHAPLTSNEATLLHANNQPVHVLINITPVETPEGMLFETTAIDVTLLKQHQAELQQARDAAIYESLNDPLTGLPNRRFLSEMLSMRLEESRHARRILAVLYVDLDGFKFVNDSLGHSIGDALLVQLANRLRSAVSEDDVVARLGGDEFMVILSRVHSRSHALEIAENLRCEIGGPMCLEGHVLVAAASIGVSFFPEDGTLAETLIQQADCAMYEAKRQGKNRVLHFTPEMGNILQERLQLENLLRGAIARNEITVHYQPEFCLNTQRLIRFEALARWTHPDLGPVAPSRFIPIAEEGGMISTLGSFVMEQACAEAARWPEHFPAPVQVAVNVSSIQFNRRDFTEEVTGILRRTGLPPHLLQIELTESVMLSGLQNTAEGMRRLREMGISLAVDDFGMGYSNLSYLPELPFDTLKIDSSLLRNLGSSVGRDAVKCESMIRTLVGLARNFDMRVIVEGVERAEQLELIRRLGADAAQGFLLGQPIAKPVSQLREMVKNSRNAPAKDLRTNADSSTLAC